MKDILSNLIITKVYAATTMFNEKGAMSKKKNRSNWAVVIKHEGETIYYQGKRKIVSNHNNPVILPKGCDYTWICTESGHFMIIEFECNSEHEEIFSFSINNSEKLLSIFKSIENNRLLKNDFYKMKSITDTYRIILSLNGQSSSAYIPSSKKAELAPVIEFIAENYTKKLTNDSLAALTKFSTVYFRKLFKEVYGTSPMEYVKGLKIKNAKEMLRSDYGSITDIAISLGYQNIYDFSRDFKKRVGVSPSNYAG